MNWQFLKTNAKWLFAPFLMALASGFGQTYYIAVYGDPIRASFNMSHGQWGGVYMIGTLISAALMMFIGSIADNWPVRKLIILSSLGLIIFSLLMAINPFFLALPLLIFGLRFFGQGMMMHIAQVITARQFKANRAKAMGIVIGGIALGEALFPMVFVRIIGFFGWRMSFIIASVLIALLGAYIYSRLGNKRTPQGTLETEPSPGLYGRDWTRREVIRSPIYWISFPAIITMPLLTTIFFFQLPVLADAKGWALKDLTAILPFFTLTAFTVMILSGAIIDKIGSRRFAPFSPITIMLGYLMMSQITSLNLALIALLVMGIGQGTMSAYSSIWLADFFGTKHLGAIRAFNTGQMIFATAIGPFLSGYLLDHGISYNWQLAAMGIYAGLACLLLLWVRIKTKNGFETTA